MGLEYAAAIISVVNVSLRLSLMIATFVQETRDSNETRSDLYHQIKNFQDTIQSVHRTFSERKEQQNRRPLSKAEGEICKAVGNALVRCEGYMERFERKIKGLGGQSVEAGWLDRALLQLSLQVKGPTIRKLERQITASISSLETLLACFHPYMHQELQDGIETNHQYLNEIRNRIKRLEQLLVQLKSPRQVRPLPAAEAEVPLPQSHNQDHVAAQAVVAELCEPNDGSCELVDETLSAARLFVERISESGTVAGLSAASEGQSQPDYNVQTDLAGQSEYNTQTPNEGGGGVRLSGCCHQRDAMEEVFKCVDSVDIMTDHVDNCKSLAETAMQKGDYVEAEKHIATAIEIGEQREHIWKFPFQESLECHELLASSMTRSHKFLEAERIYTALLSSQEVRSSPETRGRLYFSIAQFYHKRHRHQLTDAARENLFERCEQFGKLSYQAAESLTESLAKQGKDSSDPSWPKGHPTLGQAAELLENLYESWGKQGLALTYRTRKGSHSKTTNPTLAAATTPRSPTALPPTPPETEPPVSLTKSVDSSRSAFSGSNASSSPTTSWRLTVPIKKRDYETTKLVLDLYSDSVDMEQLDKDKHLTPLLLAASKKDTRIVSLLLEQANGPNIKARDPNGWTVLHHALFGRGGGDLIDLLIRAGADVKAVTADGHKMSALHFAARENNLVAAKALLDNHADINAMDDAGRTSLWLAIMNKQYKMCRLLLHSHAAFDRPAMVKAYPKIENVFWEMETEGALNPLSPLSPTDSRQSTPKSLNTESHGPCPSKSSLKMQKLFGVKRSPATK